MNVDLKLLEQILMRLPNAIFWKDNNSVYRGCNINFAKSVGFNHPEEVIGKNDEQMPWDSESAKLYREEDLIILNGGTIVDKEVSLPIDKTEKIILISKTALYDSEQNIIGVLGVYTDITKEKQAKKAKADFISNMEHDLRTPFAGIGGVAGVLDSMYADTYPELKDLLHILVTSCTQWETIHNRIFDAIDTEQTIKVECFYLQDEVDKIKDLMQATSHIKQVALVVHYPSREETGQIETDSLILSLIISNLVGNAFNFTEKGCITIKAKRQEDSFVIEVIDTGIGIPQDKLDYIFEKFAKLARSNTYGSVFKGMGLGLYTAREDAGKIKGTISVVSELGKGSTFRIVLPLSYYAK